MDVNDAELLALAGDNSSDEATTPAPVSTTKPRSPTPAANSNPIRQRDASAGVGNSTLKPSIMNAGSKRSKNSHKDDTEEGEAYVSLNYWKSAQH